MGMTLFLVSMLGIGVSVISFFVRLIFKKGFTKKKSIIIFLACFVLLIFSTSVGGDEVSANMNKITLEDIILYANEGNENELIKYIEYFGKKTDTDKQILVEESIKQIIINNFESEMDKLEEIFLDNKTQRADYVYRTIIETYNENNLNFKASELLFEAYLNNSIIEDLKEEVLLMIKRYDSDDVSKYFFNRLKESFKIEEADQAFESARLLQDVTILSNDDLKNLDNHYSQLILDKVAQLADENNIDEAIDVIEFGKSLKILKDEDIKALNVYVSKALIDKIATLYELNEIEEALEVISFGKDSNILAAEDMKSLNSNIVKSLMESVENMYIQNDINGAIEATEAIIDLDLGNKTNLTQLVEQFNSLVDKRQEIVDFQNQIVELDKKIVEYEKGAVKGNIFRLRAYMIQEIGTKQYEIASIEYNSLLGELPSDDRAILKTVETTFSSRGVFELLVVEQAEQEVRLNQMAGNFSSKVKVYREVTQSAYNRLEELNYLWNTRSSLEVQLEKRIVNEEYVHGQINSILKKIK